MSKLIRVLDVRGGLNTGGLETRLVEIYRKIDKSKIQFDFLLHFKGNDFYEREVKNRSKNL